MIDRIVEFINTYFEVIVIVAFVVTVIVQIIIIIT